MQLQFPNDTFTKWSFNKTFDMHSQAWIVGARTQNDACAITVLTERQNYLLCAILSLKYTIDLLYSCVILCPRLGSPKRIYVKLKDFTFMWVSTFGNTNSSKYHRLHLQRYNLHIVIYCITTDNQSTAYLIKVQRNHVSHVTCTS